MELILSTGERATLTIDTTGDRTLTPWEGGEALALRDSEGEQDEIDALLNGARDIREA